MDPFVSVIIPTFNDWDRLKLCLNALEKQTFSKKDTEILVVNNSTDDDCPYQLASNVRLLREVKPGSYAARNKALEMAKGSIFCFTDSDCIPSENWIKSGVDQFNRIDEEFKVVSGNINLFYSGENPSTLAEHYEAQFGFRHLEKKASRTKTIVTANVFISKNVFEKVGPFNEKLFSGGDSDLAKRIKNSKINIHYCEQCLIKHPARKNFKDLLNKRVRIFGGKIKNKALSQNIKISGFNKLYLNIIWKELKQQKKKWKADRYRAKHETKPKVESTKVIKALNLIFIGVVKEALHLSASGKFKRE